MSSLLTNSAAMTSLQTLRNVGQSLAMTENRISTGQRVATASDNSAYWSIATSMRADNAALSAVSDALGLGHPTVDMQYSALTTVVGTDTKGKETGLAKIEALLVQAQQPGQDHDKIQAEITQIQADLKNVASSATFNGVNYLDVNTTATAYNSTQKVVSSFSRVGTTVTINTIDIDITTMSLYDSGAQTGIMDKARTGTNGTTGDIDTFSIAGLTDAQTDMDKIADYLEMVVSAASEVTQASADLGAVKMRIETNSNFVKAMIDSVTRGIGQLVDADMDAESTRLSALQVQQQLGVQALSIANANSQSILSLFR